MTKKKKIKMNIPRKVNVLGHDYRVVWKNRQSFETPRSAECEYPTREIRIARDLRKKENAHYAWLCFLHELRHAYQFECGDMQILDRQAFEKDADSFASLITSLQKQGVL